MLIDPQGMLRGERIRACSDEAQLHFPRLLAAGNSYGRFRMSVETLQNEVYGSFHCRPTKEVLIRILREYHQNFLLFVYKAADGSVWAQWDIPEKLLGRYRLSADRKSPAPPEREHAAFRAAYVESLRVKNQAIDDISAEFQNIPHVSADVRKVSETCESFQKVSHDVLVGVGVGVGVVIASETPTEAAPHPEAREVDSRHVPCREALFAWWGRVVKPGGRPMWDGSDALAMSELLKALPDLTVETFALCLKHRGESDVNLSERPRKWLRNLPDYERGALDAFGKPLASRSRVAAMPVSHRAPSVAETSKRLNVGASERDAALADWRDVRQETVTSESVKDSLARRDSLSACAKLAFRLQVVHNLLMSGRSRGDPVSISRTRARYSLQAA